MTSVFELESADRLMAGAGKTFYRAARLLPRPIRRDVVELYAFCRKVDDLADEPARAVAERRRSLGALADALDRGSLLELRAAGWPFAAQSVLVNAAGMLVRAAMGDLEQRQPETEAALLDYAFGVAGTVGVMMAEVLGAAPEGFGAAVALGMAMQLSNIARDVAEDLRQGRVYLPVQWIAADTVRHAIDGSIPADARALREATERVLRAAERLYEVAYDGIWSLRWRIRWSILAAAMCYREIGVRIGRNVKRSWRQRTVVSTGRKLWLIAIAGLRLFLPRFWRRPKCPEAPILSAGVLQKIRALGLAS